MAETARMMERVMPKGSHMNMARVANGVGMKASLPSWKTSGFRDCPLLLSAFLTR